MHGRRYSGRIASLRDPVRVRRLETRRVVGLCLQRSRVGSVLDVGTGSGLFAEAFATRGLRVAGVDVRDAMAAEAARHLPAGAFGAAAAEALPYRDGAFDLVFMGLVLHETHDAAAALREAGRVATRRVAILEWPYDESAFGPPLAHRISPARIEALAERAGLGTARVVPLAQTVLVLLLPD